MKFYHGTSTANWELIQKEGILWGGYTWHETKGKDKKAYRYTYLTPELDYAKDYGDVVLEVEYEPVGNVGVKSEDVIDNYGFDPPKGEYCWQFSVFVPIPLSNVRELTMQEIKNG